MGIAELNITPVADNTFLIRMSGNWKLGHDLPSTDGIKEQLQASPAVKNVSFDAGGLMRWDSGLPTFRIKIMAVCVTACLMTLHPAVPQCGTAMPGGAYA